MAKKAIPVWQNYIIYLIIRSLVAVIQATPFHLARQFGIVLGKIAYQIDKRHREVARNNLLAAFPEYQTQPDKIDQLVRSCYRHFLLIVIEMVFLPRRLHVHNWRKFVTLVNCNDLIASLLARKPILVATGHFGNWEMAGYVLGLVGFKTYAIARILDNPFLEKFLKGFRQKTGQTILSKNGDFERINQALAEGNAISTLADQDAGQRGLFVEFFNRPASTHKALALLAMQFQAKLFVVGIPRISEPLHYYVTVEEVIDTNDYANSPEAVRQITERYSQALERIIRRHPEQYFWLHRRWKHQPQTKHRFNKVS